MQEPRHAADGRHWLCQADDCNEIATLSWSRKQNDQGDITSVYACGNWVTDPEDPEYKPGHKLTDEQASLVHQTTCTAPPTCDCTPEPPS